MGQRVAASAGGLPSPATAALTSLRWQSAPWTWPGRVLSATWKGKGPFSYVTPLRTTCQNGVTL
jgi:hypothetical protein